MCCYRQEVTQVNVASGWNLKANAQGCKTQAHLCPRTPVAAPCPQPGECCSSRTGICFFAGRSPPIYIQKTFILFIFFFTQPSPPPFLFLTRKTNSNSSSFGGRSLLTRAPSGGTIWGCYQRARARCGEEVGDVGGPRWSPYGPHWSHCQTAPHRVRRCLQTTPGLCEDMCASPNPIYSQPHTLRFMQGARGHTRTQEDMRWVVCPCAWPGCPHETQIIPCPPMYH